VWPKHGRKIEIKMCVKETDSVGTEINRTKSGLVVHFKTENIEVSVPVAGGEFLDHLPI
jgi:hypothetical protein